MITRVELNGFKTFQDFQLELAPFQVIVGANGAGKSNLFDAFRLLSRLADTDLRSAFQALRGEAGELFTTLPDGQPVDQMRLAVEMLVERQVSDSWGAQAKLKHPRLRYEVHIARRVDEQGLERLYVTHESLAPIGREHDAWIRRYVGGTKKAWLPPLKGGRGVLFISTTKIESGPHTLSIHQAGHSGTTTSVAAKAAAHRSGGVHNTE